MIRPATLDDLYPIKDFLLGKKERNGYGHLNVDETLGMRNLSRMMNSKQALVLVSYRDDKLVAVIAAMVFEYWCSSKDFMVSDVVFVSEDPRATSQMVDRVESWAWGLKKNIVAVTLGISSGVGVERTGAFYQAKGYDYRGGNYTKVRSDVAEGGQRVRSS
jgi:hypothetical protein